MRSLVYAREPNATALSKALSGPVTRVKNRKEFLNATLRGAGIAFVDVELLGQVEGETSNVPIVGIVDDSLPTTIKALGAYPWLSHLVASSLLTSPFAKAHLKMFEDRIAEGPEHVFLGPDAIGRVALLTSSNRREHRFERMREFFGSRGISTRTVTAISDVAEELVTNALYDAPVEAKYFKAPVPRTEDVELPPAHACEISYGIDHGSGFVRVRDPFGALTRVRLLGVLNRCNSNAVALDESRGGAGLGLWRVFSSASTIAITVIPGRLTDILVRVQSRKGKSVSRQTLGVHLFFPDVQALDGAQGRFAADHDYDLMDESFTSIHAA
ncbi:MAG: hypothetical protein WKG01_17355 [Kofleriaceae bacterium]